MRPLTSDNALDPADIDRRINALVYEPGGHELAAAYVLVAQELGVAEAAVADAYGEAAAARIFVTEA